MKSKLIVNIKNLISILICSTIISSTLPANLLNYVVFANNESIYVSTFEELRNALSSSNNGDVIVFNDNITIPDDAALDNNVCLVCSGEKTVTINGNNHTLTNAKSSNIQILYLLNGPTVNLNNITIDCGGPSSTFDQYNAIEVGGFSTLNMSETTLKNFKSTTDKHLILTGYKTTISLNNNSSIMDCETTSGNGIIYIDNNSTLQANSSSISNCNAANGGAIFVTGSSHLLANNLTINHCQAANGGAIFLQASDITLSDSQITNCSSTTDGAAIYINGAGISTINNSTISNCSAMQDGGAIYSNGSGQTYCDNIIITNCTTARNGGGICNSPSSELTIYSGDISGCYSTNPNGKGNAIYNNWACKTHFTNEDIGLISITVPANALGQDNSKEAIDYDGIFYENINDATTASQIILCTVTFDPNGGVDSQEVTPIFDPIYIKSGETLGEQLPTNLTKNGVALSGWIDDNNNTITANTPITSDVNLKAQYTPLTPQITLKSLTKADDSPYTAGDWSNKNINFVYNVSSSTSNINPDKYKISIDGGTTFTDIVPSTLLQINQLDDSNLSFTILQDGEYNIVIEAYDAENRSDRSESISVKLDKIKPDPVIIDSSEYSNSDTPTIYGIGEKGCTITVTDENNNEIGTAVVDENGEWEISEPLSEGEHTISVVQTDIAGNTSEPTSKTLTVDTILPTGTIKIRSNDFNKFVNTITFGLLFNDTTNVTITADDTPSGVKELKYLKTDQGYSSFSEIPTDANWQNADISNENSVSFNVDVPQELFNDKFFVYAKITDNANNVTYIRSDGVILYTDSAITTDEITYTKPKAENKELSIILNGNTIANVVNTTINYTLQKDADYTIEDSKIILKHEYLNQLPEDAYTLEISFTPAGETNIAEGLTLPKDTVILYVERSTQQLPSDDAKFNNLNSSYTYGDIPGIISLNGGSGTGAIAYEIKPDPNNSNVATIDQNTGNLTIVGTGVFQVVATKAADENYKELQVTSDFITVNKRPVTISGIVAKSKIYDGNNDATFDADNAQIQNLVNNDQITIGDGHASFANENAENDKEVYFSGFSILDSSGNTSKNYVLESQPANGSADITPKPVTITGIAVDDKPYDGNRNATIKTDYASISGKLPNDNLEIVTGSATFSDKNAGNDKIVTFSGFGLGDDDANNYSLSAQPENTTANISTKTATINISIKDKVYDGTTTAEFAEGFPTIEGFVAGDDVHLNTTGTPAFSNKNFGDNKWIVLPPFSLTGDDKDNYTLTTQPINVTANIQRKPLTITDITANDKPYDGTSTATFNISVEGKVGNEDVSVNIESATFSDKNAGNDKIVTFSGFTLSGNDKANYTIPDETKSSTANITRKPLTISNVKIKDKPYDGTNTAELDENPTISDFVENDDVQLVNGTPIFSSTYIGQNIPINFWPPFSLTGNDAQNYDISQPENATASIYTPTSSKINAPTLTKDNNEPYTAGSWSNKNVTASYTIESGSFPIDSTRTQISLDKTTFVDLTNVDSSKIQINQSDSSNVSFTILQDGEYRVQIKIFDTQGNANTSNSVSIKIDKAKPDSVAIDSSEYSNSSAPTISGTGEPGCIITITDENDHEIGTTSVDENGKWQISKPISEGEHTISVVQTDSAGNSSEPVSKTLVVDTTPPTGVIRIRNNDFNTFLNTITFGLLFKETTNVTILASDDYVNESSSATISFDGYEPSIPTQHEIPVTSGVKEIKYLKTDQVYSDITDIPTGANWQTSELQEECYISFDVDFPPNQLNDKFFIYAKITDKADNVTYLRSDGIILYKDSAVTTSKITHFKPEESNKELLVTLNGNTIASVVNTPDNQPLIKNVDYTVENNKIILSYKYLNKLAENTYELEISFTPAGEPNIAKYVALPQNTVTLEIKKSNQELSPDDANFNNLNSSYTYGDDPGIISLNGGSGTGDVTYEIVYDPENPDVAEIDTNTGKLTIKNAGKFTVTATKAADDNYNSLTVTSNEITVNPRPVTISGIVADSKTYDGDNTAKFNITSAQIQNLVNNDQLSISPGSASFSDKNAGNNKEVYFSNFAILDSSGNTPKNYVLQSQPANSSANITPLKVTITGITVDDKPYDGNRNATIKTDGASISGKLPNDNLEIVTGSATFSDKNAAQGKTVTFTGFGLSGNDAKNYSLSAQPENTTANISKKPAIINISIKDKVYDGTTTAEFAEGFPTIENFITEDNVELNIEGSPTFSSKNVGDNKWIVLPIFSLTGDDKDNYTLTTQPENLTANITRKALKVSGITVENKPYDGTTRATFSKSNMSIEGIIDNENVSVDIESVSFDDKNVGNNKTVSFSGFTLSGSDKDNYTLSEHPDNATANITPLPVTITNITADNKIYDGTVNATPNISNGSIPNTIPGDNLFIVGGSATFANKNVGPNKVVTFSDFSLGGNDKQNYTLSAQPENATANISPKILTISNIKIKDKILDGTRTAEFEGTPTLEGLADGDNVTLVNGTPIFASAAEGQGIAIEFDPPFSLEGADALNYYITQPANVYGNIAYPSGSQESTDSDRSNKDQPEETTPPEDETTPSEETGISSDTSDINTDDDMEEAFEAEDSVTGIQVSAPKGVLPRWCRLIVREMYQNTTEYDDNYENLDEEKRSKIEHAKLYEIYIINQDGQIVQPDISKGLITVNIPVPNDYDLADIEIYRIKEDADDDFDENVVNINNKSYCQFETDHFSPYTMIDENSFNDLIQAIIPYLLLLLILIFLILLIIILVKRKKEEEEEEKKQQQ